MRAEAVLLLAGLVATISACDRSSRTPADSVAQPATTSDDRQWVTELGPLLAIPGDSENSAILLVPSTPAQQLDAVVLRTAGDSSRMGRLRLLGADAQVCDDASLATISGAAPGWTLAVSPGITPMKLDSIETLSPSDSALLAADVARLASAVSHDDESRFSGLPFAVLAAHRLQIDGISVVVGHSARRIPQEAAPQEERTLVVGERAGRNPFALKYSLRSAGAEDAVAHYGVLGALRAADKTFLVIESERENETRYEILERDASGAWRLRWSRALSC